MSVEQEFWKKAEAGISLDDYPKVIDNDVAFPNEIYIAYAVCTKDCGRNEFIVDGSTQICQYSGQMMFRTAVRKYILAPDDNSE